MVFRQWLKGMFSEGCDVKRVYEFSCVGKTLTCSRCRPVHGGLSGGCGNILPFSCSSYFRYRILVIEIEIITYFISGFSGITRIPDVTACNCLLKQGLSET